MATWRDLWTLVLGYPPAHAHVESPVLAVLLFDVIVFTSCFLLYKLSDHLLPGMLRSLALDFIKSMVFITYAFGNGFMRRHHGNLGYFIWVVPLNLISFLVFSKGRISMISTIVSFTRGQINFLEFALHCMVQTLSGFAAFRLGLFVLQLDFHEDFGDFAHNFFPLCESDLKLPLVMGFALEMTGTAVDAWVFHQQLSKHVPIDLSLKFMNTAGLVIYGYKHTGMFMNPVMATGLSQGCGATPLGAFILVYWVAPIVGAFLGIRVDQHFHVSLVRGNEKAVNGVADKDVPVTAKRKQA